jgi:hypothetical protein
VHLTPDASLRASLQNGDGPRFRSIAAFCREALKSFISTGTKVIFDAGTPTMYFFSASDKSRSRVHDVEFQVSTTTATAWASTGTVTVDSGATVTTATDAYLTDMSITGGVFDLNGDLDVSGTVLVQSGGRLDCASECFFRGTTDIRSASELIVVTSKRTTALPDFDTDCTFSAASDWITGNITMTRDVYASTLARIDPDLLMRIDPST